MLIDIQMDLAKLKSQRMSMAVSMRPHLGQGRSPFGISHEIK